MKNKITNIDKSLSKEVLRRLSLNKNFSDVCQLAFNTCCHKPYLVGGKVYRTLVEVLYDYPARSECCDYDFISTRVGATKRKIFDGWLRTRASYKSGAKRNKSRSLNLKSHNGCRVDIMSLPCMPLINEGKYTANLIGYFGIVPLSIQAIAMDIEKGEIFGLAGPQSIKEHFVWVNNKHQIKNYAEFKKITEAGYIEKKAKSIRFGFEKLERPKSLKAWTMKPMTWQTLNWATTGTATTGTYYTY